MAFWTWLEGLSGGAASFVGSVSGFVFAVVALLIGASYNFWLNRRRDVQLRQDEARAIAAALYGEILLLRRELGHVAKITSSAHMNEGWDGPGVKFDKHFLERMPLSQPTLYNALAPKLGLLDSTLLLSIVEFYSNLSEVRQWLPRLVRDEERGYEYSSLVVLDPATSAIYGVKPALRRIESELGIREIAPDPDIGSARAVIADENERFGRKE